MRFWKGCRENTVEGGPKVLSSKLLHIFPDSSEYEAFHILYQIKNQPVRHYASSSDQFLVCHSRLFNFGISNRKVTRSLHQIL